MNRIVYTKQILQLRKKKSIEITTKYGEYILNCVPQVQYCIEYCIVLDVCIFSTFTSQKYSSPTAKGQRKLKEKQNQSQ